MKTLLALVLAMTLVGSAAAATDPIRVRVAGKANIFGAGFTKPPQPGSGGAGWLPPVVRLPGGSTQIVTFPRITGKVTPIVDWRQTYYNGAQGTGGGVTDIESWNGISGIVDRNVMFLVGVFLTDDRSPLPAPPRLDFTHNEKYRLLAPQIGQTFYIGNGKGRSVRAPKGATRLFLGFTDAEEYKGLPGLYGNNGGSLVVTVQVTRK